MKGPLMRGSDLRGHPVVDADTGDAVASVRDVVFDPKAGGLVGFTLQGRQPFGHELSVDSVESIGSHAVMIAGAPRDDTDHGVQRVAAAETADEDVLDDLVVTESGRELGKIKDVIIRGGSSPRIVAFEIGGGDVGDGLVPLSRNLGMSNSALIVPDEYESLLRRDLVGLDAQLDELEEEASR